MFYVVWARDNWYQNHAITSAFEKMCKSKLLNSKSKKLSYPNANADATRKCKTLPLSTIGLPLINLDETRPELRSSCNTINSRQITRCKDDGSQSKTVAEGSSVKWEVGSDSDFVGVCIDIEVLDLGDDGCILLIDEDELEVIAIVTPRLRDTTLWDGEAEVNVLVSRLDVCCVDIQSTEHLEVDGVEVGAGAWDDEVLVEG